MSRMTFRFDASACSGCKACQIACQDRNGLSPALPWRRVFEVAGGSWQPLGDAWRQDVFAYHLSISCNHCEQAICMEGCPASAIRRRSDGVVLIDAQRCLGCGYCSWVCPYGSPRYDETAGVMGKCTFCAEDLDAGIEPACVAACPVRALEAADVDELRARYGDPEEAVSIPPLPDPELTRPALVLAPHAQAERSRQPDTEWKPRPAKGLREKSLVVFTLLSQVAAGLALFTAFLRTGVFGAADPERYDPLLLGSATVLLVLAMAFSALHLGRPGRAVRSLANLRASWLSREILAALLLLGVILLAWLPGWRPAIWFLPPVAIAYVAGMAHVYRQRTVPVWNTWRTTWNFFRSAILLGGLAGAALVTILDWPVARPLQAVLIGALLILESILQIRQRRLHYERFERVGI